MLFLTTQPEDNCSTPTQSLLSLVEDVEPPGHVPGEELVLQGGDGDSSTIDFSQSKGLQDEPRRNLEPVYNIPILPQLPKFKIIVNKAPQQSLG